MPKKKPKFEEALLRLSDIIETIEDSETTLDSAIKLYKEGLVLAVDCGDILSHYESEVLLLQKDANEKFSLTTFTEGA